MGNWMRENNSTQTPPYFLLKHHFPFDFTKYGMNQPTYINVMRDPIDWFQSHYYFERFGWQQIGGDRGFRGTDAERNMIIDECVLTKSRECVQVQWRWIEFFCGNGQDCLRTASNVVEITKTRIQRVYYMVGILEQWENTLDLFERMMPQVYRGVRDVWKSDRVQGKRNSTKSVNNVKMNAESRAYFQNGPLRKEYDVYLFTRALFNERLRRMNIPEVQRYV